MDPTVCGAPCRLLRTLAAGLLALLAAARLAAAQTPEPVMGACDLQLLHQNERRAAWRAVNIDRLPGDVQVALPDADDPALAAALAAGNLHEALTRVTTRSVLAMTAALRDTGTPAAKSASAEAARIAFFANVDTVLWLLDTLARKPEERKRIVAELRVSRFNPEVRGDFEQSTFLFGSLVRLDTMALGRSAFAALCWSAGSVTMVLRLLQLDLLRETQRKFKLTAVMVSHDVPQVFAISDQVAYMHAGRIAFHGPAAEVAAAKNENFQTFLAGKASGEEERPLSQVIATPGR